MYAELQLYSNFSFLRGGSHPNELVSAAKSRGLAAIAVTDRNSFAGVVRAHIAAKACDIQLVVGCRLDLSDGPSLLAYPTDRAAYGRLARLLSTGKQRALKGECDLYVADLADHAEGSHFVIVPPERLTAAFDHQVADLVSLLPGPHYLAACHSYAGRDRRRIEYLADYAAHHGLRLLATNNVLYHSPDRRPLQDVLSCIREGVKVHEAGHLLASNAERHIKSPEEMGRLFKGYDHALAASMEIADSCNFSLDELKYEYPDEPVPAGKSPQQHLSDLAWQGAHWRYPDGVPKNVQGAIARELELIEDCGYAPYFLTVYDIVNYARTPQPDKGRHDPILCQGRGSAANSAVCFCLGITSVDPSRIDLLFERFVTKERNEPPDIDVDFEHERREEVIQYIYERYGRDHAGITATIITYRTRSAVREVGKVMGLTEDITSALAGTIWGSHGKGVEPERAKQSGIDPTDPLIARVIELTEELIGFPRHLSQHVGGFVLTRRPLIETVPIGNAAMDDRTFIEWDKDDIEALGIMKVDVLGLGMLTCIRKGFDLLRRHHDIDHTLASLPPGDSAVYDMICAADTLGVFQIESRAQMSMLPRLRPRKFYDLVIEVAIVRPGPIQGDMVHPYLRRRNRLEVVDYPSPHPDHGPADELSQILGKTLGVPLFQEQAMRIAMVAAKFTPGELNELRHAMATFRRRGTIHTLEKKMVSRMIKRGYDPEFAMRCFNQIKGFGEYGFPESHAASFAHLVYASCWLKHHYPAIFACALLNSQPMGFYAPAQIIRDARAHGVKVRPPDVNHSDWDGLIETVEPGGKAYALRLGLRHVDGLGKDRAEDLMAARDRPFASLGDLQRRAGLRAFDIEKLALADAFRSIGLDRRQAGWEARALTKAAELPLFDHNPALENSADMIKEPAVELPQMAQSEHVVADYRALRLSLKGHPIHFLRDEFLNKRIVTAASLKTTRANRWVSVAGVVLVRQRPGTANGVVFMTLEDETGVANIIVWKSVMEKFRPIVMGARLVVVHGKLQSEENVQHLVANQIEDHTHLLDQLAASPADGPVAIALAHADEVARPVEEYRKPKHDQAVTRAGAAGRWKHPRDVRILPKSRDFH